MLRSIQQLGRSLLPLQSGIEVGSTFTVIDVVLVAVVFVVVVVIVVKVVLVVIIFPL